MKVLKPFEKQEKTIKIHSKIEMELVKAFQVREIDNLKEYLSENGTYLGFSKRIFIAKMQDLFNQYKNYSCNYIFGIANQTNTCNKVHEFTYTDECISLDNNTFVTPTNSLNHLIIGNKLNKNQFRLQLILSFEEYEIIEISKPLKALNLFEFYQAKKEN